ncbi:hypothetical protein GW17_00058459 [Ensete ventricosum]|nr:hypothetical protein GW17_00058459 [Ensete ventricosum]
MNTYVHWYRRLAKKGCAIVSILLVGTMQKRNIEAAEKRISLRPDAIQRTIFVSNIGRDVSYVIDCRICGDPHSALRFALVEFDNDSERMQSAPERARCIRTVYVNNIDSQVNWELTVTYVFYSVFISLSISSLRPLGFYLDPTGYTGGNNGFIRDLLWRGQCVNLPHLVFLIIHNSATLIDDDDDDDDDGVANLWFVRSFVPGQVSRLKLLKDRANSSNMAFVEFVSVWMIRYYYYLLLLLLLLFSFFTSALMID